VGKLYSANRLPVGLNSGVPKNRNSLAGWILEMGI
jgi:hypothetical protein